MDKNNETPIGLSIYEGKKNCSNFLQSSKDNNYSNTFGFSGKWLADIEARKSFADTYSKVFLPSLNRRAGMLIGEDAELIHSLIYSYVVNLESPASLEASLRATNTSESFIHFWMEIKEDIDRRAVL